MTPRKFRKKPVVIEAMQWDGKNLQEIVCFCPRAFLSCEPNFSVCLTIPTLEGNLKAIPGDWIIKGVQGEFYPVKDEIFRKTYEEAEGQGTSVSDKELEKKVKIFEKAIDWVLEEELRNFMMGQDFSNTPSVILEILDPDIYKEKRFGGKGDTMYEAIESALENFEDRQSDFSSP